VSARYLEARDAVERLIAEHDLQPGDRLPTERDLSEELGLARPTVRRAMATLERAGRIERRQGSGTYVAEPCIAIDARVLVSFSRGALAAGFEPAARILLSEHVPASRELAALFGLRRNEPLFHVERVRTASGVPIALERSWFPDALVPGLDGEDLEHRSIYALLESRYGLMLRRAEQELAPVVAGDEEVEQLGCSRGTPLMLIRRRAFDGGGRAVEYAEDRYLGHRSRFRSEALV
jgi:GntR family transcriptional regulator